MRGLGNSYGLIAAAALVSVPAVAAVPGDGARRRIGKSPALGMGYGQRHSQAREIARRLRQAERLRQKYMLNGGFSRRGREVGPI